MLDAAQIEAVLAQPDHGREGPPGIDSVVVDGVAVVTIDNASARNAISLRMWAQLRDVFRELAREDGVAVAVLRGAGERAFAAGADIGEFREIRMTVADAARYNEVLSDALRAIADAPFPVIAAIRGYAVGGGCEIAAACDLRVAGRSARIGIPIGRLGVILGVTEAQLLVRLIGASGLKRLLLTGDLLDAAESLRIGLVDEVTDTEAPWRRAAQIAAAIAASSPVAVRASKAVADRAGRLDADGVEQMHRFMVDAYGGAYLREGVDAFLDKRPPVFSGRNDA